MNIGILANEGSWYYRDLERAALARGDTCQRLEFERLIGKCGARSAECGVEGGESSLRIHAPPSAGYSVLGTQYSLANPGSVSTITTVSAVQPSTLRPQPSTFSVPHSALRTPHFFDLVLVRTMPPGSLEQVVYRMDVLGRLQASGVKVVNSPKSLECAVDKYLTTAKLHEAGLPVPETIVCEHEDDALAAFHQLGGDVVVKPLFGAEGRGIVRVSDPDLAHRTFRTLMRLDAVLYLQRFIDHEGFDVRVLVLNGRSLGAIRRRSPDDFRTNVARNATAESHEATPREIELALHATAVTGAFIAGVDLLYDRAGHCYVIEVNAVPGWQAFAKSTGLDVAARLLDEIAQQA